MGKFAAENPGARITVEKAEQVASIDSNIVVATVQTLAGQRLKEFIGRFGRRIALFVIDEAHHAAAPTYRAIVDAVVSARPDAMVFGFTATPNRGDGVRLIDVFHKIVFSMDARAAIAEGFLVPVRSYGVATKTNLDGVASRLGDFVIGQLAAAVNTVDRNRRIVDAYRQHTPGMKALVFTASVQHARDVCDEFRAAGIKASFASGETPTEERERVVSDFRNGKSDVLVNCGLYLEGFDVPSIQVVINARPTKSTTLYTQITGRGLRPVDEIANALSDVQNIELRRELIAQSPKPYAIVLDMVDQAHRHELVTLPSLWGLPPQIDAQGRPVSQVAQRFEQLYALDPRAAARVRTAEQIETALIEIEARSKRPEEVPWTPLTPEHWRRQWPAQRVARDRFGRPIPNFGKHFETLVAEAKRIAPLEDAEAFAYRVLNVNPRTIGEEAPQVDVERHGDQWVATLTVGTRPPRELLSAPTLPEAFYQAEMRMLHGGAETLQQVVHRTSRRNGSSRRRFRRRRRHAH
ncbi:MAG: DEAD/DEAH box helicase [Candidatus Eremiobacteraeota bacterium]|nr:DEAD/DEAH box helicase [Candidatus Eremiobacteraeota bacterium]